MTAAKRYTNSEAVSEAKKRVTKWKAKHPTAMVTPRRASGFLKFCRKMACEYEDVPEALDRSTGRSKRNSALVKAWQALSQPERDMFEKKAAARCPDPVSSKLRPDSNFGSVSETLDEIIENYVSEKKNGKGFSEVAFRDLVSRGMPLIS